MTQISTTQEDLIGLAGSQLWDFAGIDGLQLAKRLVGNAVERIAPFQSLETTINCGTCSLLRLCEGNFRLRIYSHAPEFGLYILSLQSDLQVWVKQCQWIAAIALPESVGLNALAEIAVPKPPYRLKQMSINSAAPARIDGTSVLIWRHFIQGQPVFELHTAAAALETVKLKLTTEPSTKKDMI